MTADGCHPEYHDVGVHAPTEPTTHLYCPLCDWHQEREVVKYAASNHAAAPAIAEAMGMPADALLSIHARQATRRDEHTLERHLSTHPLIEWVTEIVRLRAALGVTE